MSFLAISAQCGFAGTLPDDICLVCNAMLTPGVQTRREDGAGNRSIRWVGAAPDLRGHVIEVEAIRQEPREVSWLRLFGWSDLAISLCSLQLCSQ